MKGETKEVKKIKLLSAGKIFAAFGVLAGLVYGIYTFIISLSNPISFSDAIAYATQNPQDGIMAIATSLKWFAIIVAPLITVLVYFIYGVIIALVYNILSKIVGGIKVELH